MVEGVIREKPSRLIVILGRIDVFHEKCRVVVQYRYMGNYRVFPAAQGWEVPSERMNIGVPGGPSDEELEEWAKGH